MKLLRYSSLALAAALMLPAAARAQVTLQFDGVVNPGAPTVQGAATGPYAIHQIAPTVSSSFNVYCIDFDHTAQTTWPARYITFAQAVGADNAAAVRQLGTGVTLGNLRTAAFLSTKFGSAAVSDWDDIHGAIWSLFSPSVALTAGMNTQLASAVTANAATNTAYDADYTLVMDNRAWDNNFAASGLNQGFMVEDDNIRTNVVPEPSTYVLMGAGLFAVGLIRRRRNNA